MRHRKIVGTLLVSLSLTSCSLFKTSCTCGTVKGISDTDSLSVIYTDSIDSILFCANKVRIYDMADFVLYNNTIENGDSIFNYKIKKNIGFLKKEEIAILSFIISDKSWYIKNYTPIRQPFHPNFTLEFTHKKNTAFMFVSFGTEEIAISDSEGNFKFYKMRDKHIMARWAYIAFPEEEYYKELIKQ